MSTIGTPATGTTTSDTARPSARQRLLDAATRLFYGEGIHSVGVDRIIDEAGVTRATMYKQFAGKEGLVLAYLHGEDEVIRTVFAAAGEATSDPSRLLDLVVEGIAADIRDRHTRGCPFINAAAEYPDDGPVRALIAEHRTWFRQTLADLAAAAGLRDPDEVAGALVLLRDAAMVGGYLDRPETVVGTFQSTAHTVIDTHR
ncbi:MAG: TetR/AcrR family transcriptional regulator [Microbacterium sp.]|uniref:TetR/AcrR family transcriptional regulator n=1 Tax=Microbacterium sp. TaxID=51671 RepID=UPI001AC88F14|nr:TetR/AcrR family transcriptional regulator [Microbacterium sp.]MBN9154032.1 TetR/AcrR family transcriptional regulator [Microbacterium sp.]MBN9174425.1 TetR/AcrR family transcriptional regulator [Microbacterium sp.]MBN9196436.1 TetR/AcrR family transcriptional regulator [Microbacterium sp.]